MSDTTLVTVETTINAPLTKVWECWTQPQHVTQWNHASDDWHSPIGTNDLREGGKFVYRMEAKDRSVGFDFGGTYTKILDHKQIDYSMDDGRTVSIAFDTQENGTTHITETFEAEDENPIEMQRQGWQSILNNFKKYTESQTS